MLFTLNKSIYFENTWSFRAKNSTVRQAQQQIHTFPYVSGQQSSLLIAQYGALRSEIHQRVDQRQQLLTYTLIGAASFFGIGLQSWVSGVTVLCYPLLAFFLACAWSQHHKRIKQITLFLGEIEDKYLQGFAPGGWERYRDTTFRSSFANSVSFSARGLFAGSELLALIIGLARYTPDSQMAVVFVLLAVVDALAVLATLLVLSRRQSLDRKVCDAG